MFSTFNLTLMVICMYMTLVAGCTGVVRKVAPGEELHLYNGESDISTQKYDLIPPSQVNVLGISDVHDDSSTVSDSKLSRKSKSR